MRAQVGVVPRDELDLASHRGYRRSEVSFKQAETAVSCRHMAPAAEGRPAG